MTQRTFLYAVVQYKDKREEFFLGDNTSWKGCSIGNAETNDIVVKDPAVPELQAVIERVARTYYATVSVGVIGHTYGNYTLKSVLGVRADFTLPLLVGKTQIFLEERPFSKEETESLKAFLAPYQQFTWPPVRPSMAAIWDCSGIGRWDPVPTEINPEEAQELWERLAARGLIPQEWLFTKTREFRLNKQRGFYPLSIEQAVLLASKPQAIVTAELIIPELLYAVEPWGISGAKYVVWSAESGYSRVYPAIGLLEFFWMGVLTPYKREFDWLPAMCGQPPGIKLLAAKDWWWRTLAAKGVSLFPESDAPLNREQERLRGMGYTSIAELPNPYEPLRRLSEIGVEVLLLSPSSDEIELCLVC